MPNNIDSLVFYTALLADAEKEVFYITNNPDLPDHAKLLREFTELVTSHKNNIARLEKQIQHPAESKTDAQQILAFLEKFYNVAKDFIPAVERNWIEKLIAAAKKVIENLSK